MTSHALPTQSHCNCHVGRSIGDELQTGEIYGQTGDGSLVFTYRTESLANAEVQSRGIGETYSCVYDERVTTGGRAGGDKKKGWVRWGHPETTEVVLGGWAVGVSVGWLGLGLGWCALRRLERRYECSSAAEYWGAGVLCCIHERSSERDILMEDLGEASGTDDEGDVGSSTGARPESSDKLRDGQGMELPQQLFGGTR